MIKRKEKEACLPKLSIYSFITILIIIQLSLRRFSPVFPFHSVLKPKSLTYFKTTDSNKKTGCQGLILRSPGNYAAKLI